MGCYEFDSNSSEDKYFREHFSPGMADQQIRQAIQCCWMSLSQTRRSPGELEKLMRKLVDRALRDWHDDYREFYSDDSGS
jgi:hypothetical protein